MKTTNGITHRESSIFSKGCNCGGRPKKRRGRCNSIETDKPIEKPDLAIYSQEEELFNSVSPDWNSPDITTNNYKPFRLMEEVEVRVRNLSAVPASNAYIHFYTSPFGIGTRPSLKYSKKINISGNSEVELLFPLDQSTLQGEQRIGTHVKIEHSGDEKLINNRGSQTIDGAYTSESGRSFSVSIPVLNDSFSSREINLSIMSTDLTVSITPTSKVFAPHEQVNATLTINVPAHISGAPDNVIKRGVTVVGRLSSGELIGGATRLLRIDN